MLALLDNTLFLLRNFTVYGDVIFNEGDFCNRGNIFFGRDTFFGGGIFFGGDTIFEGGDDGGGGNNFNEWREFHVVHVVKYLSLV